MVEDGDRRPWAEVFDLILSEYPGYTDDTILDLTLGRINQMVEVIVRRKVQVEKARLRNQADLVQAEVKTMGTILMGLAQSTKAQRAMGRMVDSVSFSLDGEKKEREIPSVGKVARFFGIRPDGLVGVKQ